jgi:hypothetical protein
MNSFTLRAFHEGPWVEEVLGLLVVPINWEMVQQGGGAFCLVCFLAYLAYSDNHR